MGCAFKIGELARGCGVSRDTVRFYERLGLLVPAKRTPSRHRLYDESAFGRLRFIRGAQRLGLTLADIRELLRLRDSQRASAATEVARLLGLRARAIEREIEELQLRRRVLERTVGQIQSRLDEAFSFLERLAISKQT